MSQSQELEWLLSNSRLIRFAIVSGILILNFRCQSSHLWILGHTALTLVPNKVMLRVDLDRYIRWPLVKTEHGSQTKVHKNTNRCGGVSLTRLRNTLQRKWKFITVFPQSPYSLPCIQSGKNRVAVNWRTNELFSICFTASILTATKGEIEGNIYQGVSGNKYLYHQWELDIEW